MGLRRNLTYNHTGILRMSEGHEVLPLYPYPLHVYLVILAQVVYFAQSRLDCVPV